MPASRGAPIITELGRSGQLETRSSRSQVLHAASALGSSPELRDGYLKCIWEGSKIFLSFMAIASSVHIKKRRTR